MFLEWRIGYGPLEPLATRWFPCRARNAAVGIREGARTFEVFILQLGDLEARLANEPGDRPVEMAAARDAGPHRIEPALPRGDAGIGCRAGPSKNHRPPGTKTPPPSATGLRHAGVLASRPGATHRTVPP